MEKYSFVQKLGQGSFAVVWKARRKSDGRLVAVKQFKQSPDSWEACKQLPEVRAAAAISDRRHVVLLLEAVRHGGELFLVFELFESSLHACMGAGQRIEEPQVRWASRRLLSALAAVHAAGLVHCDVKPENILVSTDGGGCAEPTLKLCDFGQATYPDGVDTYVGTRWYRAPEMLLGARGDQAIDLWAAGVTIAELVLRRPFVPGSDVRDMLFRICGEIGAPDDDGAWPLAAKMVEVSRRASASAAAWNSLAEAGTSQAGVSLIQALLRYDGSKRLRAERALREAPFFGACMPEVPVTIPPARPVSPERLRRSREEAQAAEKRIFAGGAGAASGEGIGLSRQDSGYSLKNQHSSSSSSLPGAGMRSGSAAEHGESKSPGPVAGRQSPPFGPGGPHFSEAPAIPAASEAKRLASPALPDSTVSSGMCRQSSAGSQGAGNSDDEALAEAFWGACKAGGATAASSLGPDEENMAEEDFSSKPAFEIADRGRVRRAQHPSGLSGAGGSRTRLGSAAETSPNSGGLEGLPF